MWQKYCEPGKTITKKAHSGWWWALNKWQHVAEEVMLPSFSVFLFLISCERYSITAPMVTSGIVPFALSHQKRNTCLSSFFWNSCTSSDFILKPSSILKEANFESSFFNDNLHTKECYCQHDWTVHTYDVLKMCKGLPFGLLVCIFEGVVGQCGFVACILHHVVPCDQPLANGSSPRLKPLSEKRKTWQKIFESEKMLMPPKGVKYSNIIDSSAEKQLIMSLAVFTLTIWSCKLEFRK